MPSLDSGTLVPGPLVVVVTPPSAFAQVQVVWPMPDSASVVTALAVTAPLFHPAWFGAGEALAVTVGAVVSICTVMPAVLLLPALSVAVKVTT